MYPFYYTFYNLIIWNICFVISFNHIQRYSTNSSCSNQRTYKLLFFLFLIYSLGTFFGGDASRYEEFVKGDYQDAYFYDFYGVEGFYVFLASISHGSLLIWKFLVYGLALLATHLSFKILKADGYITIIFFVICVLCTYGSSRCVLAYSVLILGLSCLYIKKIVFKIIGIALLISTVFLHSSLILPLLLLPFSIFFTIDKKKVILLLIAFPVLVYIIGMLPDFILGGALNEDSYAYFKAEKYMSSDKWTEEGSYYSSLSARIFEILGWLYYIPMTFIALRFASKENNKTAIKCLINLSFLLLYLSWAIKLSSFPIKELLYGRYFTMIPFFLYIALPSAIYSNEKNHKFFRPMLLGGWIYTNFFYLISMYQQFYD